MGYSPWGRKESDTTEVTELAPPPARGPGTLIPSAQRPDRFTTSSTPSPKQRERTSSASSAPMSARLASATCTESPLSCGPAATTGPSPSALGTVSKPD